jgi:ribosomal protein S2
MPMVHSLVRQRKNMRISPQELFEAGGHIGHQANHWSAKNNSHVFDHLNVKYANKSK